MSEGNVRVITAAESKGQFYESKVKSKTPPGRIETYPLLAPWEYLLLNFRAIVSSKLESKQMFSQKNVGKSPSKFGGIPPGGILFRLVKLAPSLWKKDGRVTCNVFPVTLLLRKMFWFIWNAATNSWFVSRIDPCCNFRGFVWIPDTLVRFSSRWAEVVVSAFSRNGGGEGVIILMRSCLI